MQKINRVRLIADEGMRLINKETGEIGYVVDVAEDQVDLWTEETEEA